MQTTSELSIVEVTITEFRPGYKTSYDDLLSFFFTEDPDHYVEDIEGTAVEVTKLLHGLSFRFPGQTLGSASRRTLLAEIAWSQSLGDVVVPVLERVLAAGLKLLEQHKAILASKYGQAELGKADVIPLKFLTVWEVDYHVYQTEYGNEADSEWHFLGPLDEQKLNFAFKYEPDLRPGIVCLCGSTRFYCEFQEANYRETMKGNIVLTVGFYPHSQEQAHGETVGVTPEQKIALDALHLRKIDLADRVLILNVGGYIGESTGRELEYARSTGKVIEFLEPDKAPERTFGKF